MIDIIHTKTGSSVEIRDRLSFELDLIRKAGLEQYIFGLAKLLSAAKKNKKPVYLDSLDGEGSFLLYCLGITHRNPLEYNIGFASFLSLERLRMPWFGIICRKEDNCVCKVLRNPSGDINRQMLGWCDYRNNQDQLPIADCICCFRGY